MVVELSEQAFVAVEGLDEQGTHDVWTGNRSMLCVLVGGQGSFGTVLKLQSKTCVVCLSRLETRTKESNMYASHWECKTQRRNESED